MEMLDFEAFKEKYQKVPVKEYPNNVTEAVPEPVVSVQISTYQHADFIRDCLEGVLIQETEFPIEILIGEDESDDSTRKICKEYADRYPDKIRLLLHRRENNIKVHGRPTPNFQWNYTRFVCRGKYIAICEGDDYWTDPLKLQKQVDFLEANPEYVLSHHDASIVDAGGKQLSASKLPDENKRDFSRKNLMKGAFLLTLSLCFRNVLHTYPENYFRVLNGDTFLVSLLGRHGKGNYHKDVCPAVYRIHEDSMWSSESPLYKAIATKRTVEQIASTQKEIPNEVVEKVLSSCISLVSRLITDGRFLCAGKELMSTAKLLFKNNKCIKIAILIKRLTRFSMGRIKTQLLNK